MDLSQGATEELVAEVETVLEDRDKLQRVREQAALRARSWDDSANARGLSDIIQAAVARIHTPS